MNAWLIYAGVLAAMSIPTYIAFWHDKRRAVRRGRRVRESTLLTLALLGGWPGAFLASATLRHKTLKRRFRLLLWLIAAAHAAAAATIAWLRHA